MWEALGRGADMEVGMEGPPREREAMRSGSENVSAGCAGCVEGGAIDEARERGALVSIRRIVGGRVRRGTKQDAIKTWKGTSVRAQDEVALNSR